jgi:hypothetical protein
VRMWRSRIEAVFMCYTVALGDSLTLRHAAARDGSEGHPAWNRDTSEQSCGIARQNCQH